MPQTCARLGCMQRQLAVFSVHQALVSTKLRWLETAAAQETALSVPQSELASLLDCCQPRHANLRFPPNMDHVAVCGVTMSVHEGWSHPGSGTMKGQTSASIVVTT